MTDTLKATLQHDLHAAMRAREEVRVATLRMTLTAISNEEVSGTTARELSDEETLKVVAKEAKKRKESATAYRDAQRPELADREEAELAVLEGYLPEQMGDEELTAIVDRAIEQVGATSMAQMGQVMKLAQGEAAGRADGGAIAARVKARLAG
ncbi:MULTISPECIES: GatB/YqeY domain-containing protein [Janibacter]|uniref:GatB/YqeY domain-containing protein n=1 Tax=Janibacter TaxID=53457 RepID=UPI0021A73FA3|nr:GatB/YqeY domain-containing protein [Janibacter hoylei]MCT1620157.1 GatB/YqeY domain-containing protein [Janibacter hoylei]MCT2294013.1 GatB/YqeY domain-containing protein [Janibacter hoylei]MCW4601343.1 GatB/YqeY domain-containing protein [Janibacter hoylei]